MKLIKCDRCFKTDTLEKENTYSHMQIKEIVYDICDKCTKEYHNELEKIKVNFIDKLKDGKR